MRASDADRERVTEILRDAHGDGRLGQDELLQRLESTYEARTYHDLDQVIEDLPIARRSVTQVAGEMMRQPRSSALPTAPATPVVRSGKGRRFARKFLNFSWWVYGAVVAMCVVIWLLVMLATDLGAQYFWPLWVAGPWGVVLGTGELAYRSRENRPIDRC